MSSKQGDEEIFGAKKYPNVGVAKKQFGFEPYEK